MECAMSIRLILPNRLINTLPQDERIIFLAGPIRGGGNWQTLAIQYINAYDGDHVIACPCRFPPEHTFWKYALAGENDKFESQTLWERYYLERASKSGAIMFWLGREDGEHPRDPKDGPYARDTYGELGEWRMRMKYENARVVVGAEGGFPGLSVIEKNFKAVFRSQFEIYSTLHQTVSAAVMRAHQK